MSISKFKVSFRPIQLNRFFFIFNHFFKCSFASFKCIPVTMFPNINVIKEIKAVTVEKKKHFFKNMAKLQLQFD